MSLRCEKRYCGFPLVEVVDRLGRVSWACPTCARKRAGICRTCPRKVAGVPRKAVYCADCRTRMQKAWSGAWAVQHPEASRKRSLRYKRRNAARLNAKRRAELKAEYVTLTPEALRAVRRAAAAKIPASVKSARGRKGCEVRWGKRERRSA
jgi:hypothetical protein